MVEGNYNNISLALPAGVVAGSLKITQAGISWRSTNGDDTLDLAAASLDSFLWLRTTRGPHLLLRSAARSASFAGFRDADLPPLSNTIRTLFHKTLQESEQCVSGRNWGVAQLHGGHLSFVVDDKTALSLSVQDVTSAQVDTNDVRLEMNIDEEGGRADALMEITLHVPPSSTDYPAPDGMEDPSAAAAEGGGGGGVLPARALLDLIKALNPDVEGMLGGEPVAEFSETRVLAPRGNFTIELYLEHLRLIGSQEFRVRYSSIKRLFVLPRNPANQTVVAISLDPPLRKGQTFYPHLLVQFPTDEEIALDLNISPTNLEAKNASASHPLASHYDEPSFEVFSKVLRSLSNSRMARPKEFRSQLVENAYSIKCSYKTDTGLLFPLEKGFFYIEKPPMLILYDDIASVNFARQAQDAASRSSRTFDLVLSMRNGSEVQFRNIAREEWSNLLDYLEVKKIRIEDLATARAGPGGRVVVQDLGEEEEDETDEEDADFEGGEASESESESDEEEDGGATMVDEPRDKKDKKKKKKSDKKEKKKREKKESSKIKKEEGGGDDEDGDEESEEEERGGGGGKKKKKRAKKDPNAPKKAMSGFLAFSNAIRSTIREEQPDLKMTEVAKVIGERWKALGAEEKKPYEDMAAADKVRYEDEMKKYKQGNYERAIKEGGGVKEEEEEDGMDE